MRIWVDGQCLQTASRLRGLGRYVHELIRAIADCHPDAELVVSLNAAFADEGVIARDLIQRWIKPENIHTWQGVSDGGEAEVGLSDRRRLSELALAHHVRCLEPDVVLLPSPFEGGFDSATPLAPDDLPPVAAIFRHFPPENINFMDRRDAWWQRRLSRHRHHALNLCGSGYARTQALALFPNVPAVDVSAGVAPHFTGGTQHGEDRAEACAGGPYILFVGTLEPHENVGTAINAIGLLPTGLKETTRLVMAGDQAAPLLEAIKLCWRSWGLSPDNLIALGSVSEQQLASLYRSATLVIRPSLTDSFGLVALEAMACGTPVAGSNVGALREVIGEADLLFGSSLRLSAMMSKILTDPAERSRLATLARKQVAGFTWEQTAERTMQALRALVAARPRRFANGVATARKQCLANQNGIRVDRNMLVRTLALAEPMPTGLSRYIIDATETLRADAKTGIQRVVKAICANMFADTGARSIERLVAFCDSLGGWHRAITQWTHEDTGWDQGIDETDEDRILLRRGDTLTVIDSCWGDVPTRSRSLLSARLRGAEIITGLHDLVPLRLEATCDTDTASKFAKWFRSALSYSTGFICISRAIADELHAVLKGISFPRPMKIGYWHLGADAMAVPIGEGGAESTPTFLIVGTLEPRKGHIVALRAFEELWSEGLEVNLVIVGKSGWGVEYLSEAIRMHPELGRRLFRHEHVSDSELARLYAECDALIAASYGEGFGLPLVEAGYFGKPVIASDIPVFREVARGAAAQSFFAVGSPGSLADAVRTFVAERLGRPSPPAERTNWLTWAESARQLEDVVVGGNWYCTYKPSSDRPFVKISELGRVQMGRSLGLSERAHRLELVEGPIPINGRDQLRYIIRVTNLSDEPWSSEGPHGTRLGVFLGHHIVAEDGSTIEFNNPYKAIPFVLVPGEAHLMAIVVAAYWIEKGGAFIDVELTQHGVGWWGSPLRVPLHLVTAHHPSARVDGVSRREEMTK